MAMMLRSWASRALGRRAGPSSRGSTSLVAVGARSWGIGVHGLVAQTRALSLVTPSAVAREDDNQDAAVAAAHARMINKMTNLFGMDIDPDGIDELIEPKVSYLQDRGLSRTQAIRALALHPMLIKYTPEMLDRKIDWFHSHGVSDQGIVRIIARHPMTLGMSERSLNDAVEWFTSLGVEASRLPFLLSAFPQAANLSKATLDAKVEMLTSLGLDEEQIRRIIQRIPKVFSISSRLMLEKVALLESHGVPRSEISKICSTVPEILGIRIVNIKAKLALLEEFFGEKMGIEAFVRNPRLLMCNAHELRRSFTFLTTTVGYSPERISKNTLVTMRNLDRFLGPRYEYLASTDRLQDVTSSTAWSIISETSFANKYPGYSEFKLRRLERLPM